MNTPTPHAAALGHDGEMLSPSCCDAIFAAGRSTRITNTEFRVLVNIAGGYQKRADIGKAAGVSVPTVARAIAKLVELKWIVREANAGKASTLTMDATRILRDTHLTHDTTARIANETPTRITERSRIMGEPTTRITGEPYHVNLPVDNRAQHIEHASARVENNLLTLEDTSSSSERLEPSFNSRVRVTPQHVLNGSAAGMPAQDLAAVLIEHANSPWLDPDKSQGLARSAGRIRAWINAGADFDTDILPTVKAVSARQREHIRSWGYFTDAVVKAAEQRKASEAPIPEIKARHDNSTQHVQHGRGRPRSSFTEHMLRQCADDQPRDLGRLDSVAIK